MNVLYPLKNPNFNNLLFIKNYPPTEKKVVLQNNKDKKKPKNSFNSYSSSNKNLTTIDSFTKNKK
jgi:hypothetical protein